jgi:hypothetical protein
MRIVTGTAAEIYSLAIDAHEIRSCIQNLGVTKIDASVGVDNIAGLDEELSSKRYDRIYSISHLTKSRYHGQLKNSTGISVTLTLSNPHCKSFRQTNQPQILFL